MARVAGVIAALGLAGAGFADAQDLEGEADVTGSWVGTLDAAGQELRLVYNIERDDAGQLSVTMDSPDQGANVLVLSADEEAEDRAGRI